MQLWDRDSEALLAISGTEGAQLHGRLGRHHLGGPVRRDVDALGLLLLDLLLDPEVGEPKPVLHARTVRFTGLVSQDQESFLGIYAKDTCTHNAMPSKMATVP